MIVTLRTERIRTPEQVRAFLDGSEPVDFDLDDRDSAHVFVRRSPGGCAITTSASRTRGW